MVIGLHEPHEPHESGIGWLQQYPEDHPSCEAQKHQPINRSFPDIWSDLDWRTASKMCQIYAKIISNLHFPNKSSNTSEMSDPEFHLKPFGGSRIDRSPGFWPPASVAVAFGNPERNHVLSDAFCGRSSARKPKPYFSLKGCSDAPS
jgi:hypothetical protein